MIKQDAIKQDAAMTSPLIVDLALLREVKEVRFEVGLSSRRRLSKQFSGGILELRFGLRPDENGLVVASAPSGGDQVVVTVQMERVKVGPVKAISTTVSFTVEEGIRVRCLDKHQMNRMGKLLSVGDVVRLATDGVIQRLVCNEMPGFATSALTLLVGGE